MAVKLYLRFGGTVIRICRLLPNLQVSKLLRIILLVSWLVWFETAGCGMWLEFWMKEKGGECSLVLTGVVTTLTRRMSE